MYSIYWINKNNIPNIIVEIIVSREYSLFPLIILWWHIVTVNAEKSKREVLTIGWWYKSNIIICSGGQLKDISIDGDKDEWKKAQKKLEKKHISEIINKIIPIFNPLVT